MKKHISSIISWVLIIAMILLITPSLITRLGVEDQNKNVTVSLLANDLKKKVSNEMYNSQIDKYLSIGIDTASVMEDDLNAYVATGDLTCIKYNVLLHKYDDESVYVGNVIKENYPDVTLDTYVVLVKRDDMKEKMKYHLPRRYTDSEYTYIGDLQYGDFDNMDIYLFHDSHKQLWDIAIGYDENVIKDLYNKGMKIALIHKVKNYKNTEYLEDIERLVKTYNIEFINLKEDSGVSPGLKEKTNKANYEGLANIIIENDMTLAVTENVNQLSNQKFLGYDYIFNKVANEGSGKIVRAYETYDDSQKDETFYNHRTTQFFNSTMDRNIRFVTVTQIVAEKVSFDRLADYSFKAANEYVYKIRNEGFTINSHPVPYNYNVNKNFNYACCAVIMVMAVLLMLKLVFEKEFAKISVLALALSLVAFAGTMLLPASLSSLLSLYPSAYCVVQSCFAMTLLLCFYKKMKEKMNVFSLALCGLAITLATLLVASIGMGSMLSGLGYYMNNEIFRGIKLSLLVPVAYTILIFYIMFMKKDNSNLLKVIFNILNANIKVFWVIIGGTILAVGAYYIIRSGNVNSISNVEKTMRNTLTDIFSARPRTKEFLVGYPALILLAYYIKKTDIKLIQWLLAIAASILAASVTNSFCHVFTDYSVIVSRTINGLIVGAFVSAGAIVLNFIIVKAARFLHSKLTSESEMK